MKEMQITTADRTSRYLENDISVLDDGRLGCLHYDESESEAFRIFLVEHD